MFKMLTQSIPSASHEGKALNEKPGDDGNDSDGESDIVDFEGSMSENWKKVMKLNFLNKVLNINCEKLYSITK